MPGRSHFRLKLSTRPLYVVAGAPNSHIKMSASSAMKLSKYHKNIIFHKSLSDIIERENKHGLPFRQEAVDCNPRL